MASGCPWYDGSNVGEVGGCDVADWLTASDEYPPASLTDRCLWSRCRVGEREVEMDCLRFLNRFSINCSVNAYRPPGTSGIDL